MKPNKIYKRFRRLTGLAAVLLTFGIVILPASYAGAATKPCEKSLTVTDGGDSGDTTTTGQLRTAIAQVCQGGSVEVASSVSAISLQYWITVDRNVKVAGTGQTIQSGAGPVFDVLTTGHLILTGFTLSGPSGAPGIRVEGELTLKNVIVTQFYESGISASPGSFVTLNKGTVITGNVNKLFWEGGCGIYNDGGTVELFDDAAVTDNVGQACYSPAPGFLSGYGGGIFNKNGGSITLNDDAIVSGNYLRYCDISRCHDPSDPCPTGRGGGISSFGGTVTLNGSAQVSGNWAGSGGGVDLEGGASLTLHDNAMVTGNEAGNTGGGVWVYRGSQLTLNGSSTISGNTAGSSGGGVYNGSSVVTLNGTASITGNTAGGNGGGVYNSSLGSSYPLPVLVVNDLATITGNTPNDVYP